MLKGEERYEVVRTLGGTYGIRKKKSNSPWPQYFNISKNTAQRLVRKLNSGKYKTRFPIGFRKFRHGDDRYLKKVV
jgi:hypothetical protein